MTPFLLKLANADFAAGKGAYPADSGRAARFSSTLAKVLLLVGAAATLAAGVLYLYQVKTRDSLVASVRTVTAKVTGCEGPGRYLNIHFQYEVDGKSYNPSAYLRQTQFVGASGLTDACAAGTVHLRYLAGEPNRWSIAPLSPLKREEMETSISAFEVAAGPMALLGAGIFWATGLLMKKQKLRQERLGRDGVILPAELIKSRAETGDDTPDNIRCDYRFTTPQGTVLRGSSSGLRRDLKKKDFPPPGTPMLVLYVNDQLFEAL